MARNQSEMQEPSIDADKLSYEIFSILESKFLFGYENQKLWIPKQIPPSIKPITAPDNDNGIQAIKNQRGKICVLSIDGGGGMRSILAGKALACLENSLKTKSGNPDARIADYFDVAAGSGIGGIFAAMLFGTKDHRRPIFHAEDTWKFLAAKGRKLYPASGSKIKGLFRATGSATVGLEKALKEVFTDNGRNLTLKDTLKPVLIPCYDLSSCASLVFSRADAVETESFDFRLSEVCRATAAEPAMFEPVVMKSVDGKTRCLAVDGGLAMGNPTATAITHVLHNKQEFPFVRGVEDILVLSLGNGQLLGGRYDYDKVKRWKAKDWARPMARISGDGSVDLVDHAVAMAFGQCRGSNYVRIQANGSTLGHSDPSVDFDPSSSNVNMLTRMADEMLKQKNVESVLFGGKRISEQSNFDKLDWFCGEIVMEHQRRSGRIAPTVAFKQAAPTAPKRQV